eukprot:CAMPEP_0174302432 /NCGR_PEP_ID=MMETSP0809-20121228/59605_1 /TAXON_ID=73025 ORGANISM="Eutreptiella gymnastica-like, Strain CCMP1594" /NCGR_SAMPLE_ID=MMETSP0809 /ASSEMBLY_ACC=CAM_ASM_000658 /LENGTH=464 /DNA_ID=CAMNT_0015408343 /DNA_START=24 /DNA_END=1419 /DNA_ORIENTATION=+
MELQPKQRAHLIVVLIFVVIAYFAKYFCISDLYAVTNLYESHEHISPAKMSQIFAGSYVLSVLGKLSAGVMSDSIGGKLSFMISAVGFVASTLLFTVVESSYINFLFLWSINGYFALGMAWVCVVALSTNWIPPEVVGRYMAIVSLAPQLGDVLARTVLSFFVTSYSWRGVFHIAAACAVLCVLPLLLFVKEQPPWAEGLYDHHDSPTQKTAKLTWGQRVWRLVSNPVLWLVCTLSGALYSVRAIFLLYVASFLVNVYCHGDEKCKASTEATEISARASALFTTFGCVSVLIVGYLKDVLPKRYRGAMLACFVGPLALMMAIGWLHFHSLTYGQATALSAAVGFFLFGPYKVLGGALAVDIGGKELKATASSLMGVFDNLAAVVVLLIKGWVGTDWVLLFQILFGIATAGTCAALGVWARDMKMHEQSVGAKASGSKATEEPHCFPEEHQTPDEPERSSKAQSG